MHARAHRSIFVGYYLLQRRLAHSMGGDCVFCGGGADTTQKDFSTTTTLACCGATCHHGCLRRALVPRNRMNCCSRSQDPPYVVAGFCQYSEPLTLKQCTEDATRIDRGLAEAELRYYGDGLIFPATLSKEEAVDMMFCAQLARVLLSDAVHNLRLLKLRSCSKKRRQRAGIA